jgi:Na+/H+-dicarboxylate symporter
MRINNVSIGSTRVLTLGSLGGLTLAFLLGIVAHNSGNTTLLLLASTVKPLGTMWARGLLMIVIPLVTSYLFVAIAGLGEAKRAARIGGLSFFAFVAMLVSVGALTVAVGPHIVRRAPVSDAGFATLAAEAAAATPVIQPAPVAGSGLEWISELIPTNPFGAAAEGDILGILIFTVLFALAAARLSSESRDPLLNVAAAVAETCMTLVRWLLIPLPFAVFALAYPMAVAAGFALAGAILWFILVICALHLVLIALLYLVTWLVGGVSPSRFQRGVLPAQLVAIGTRSSLASLPAMLVSPDEGLHMDRDVANLVLPLSVSTFKINRMLTSPFNLMFLAHVYGLTLSPEYLIDNRRRLPLSHLRSR